MVGFRRKMSIFIRGPVTLAIGFLCLVAGTGIATYITLNELLMAFQMDIFLGGMIVAAITAVSLFLITRKHSTVSKDKIISDLNQTILALENLLKKSKVAHIPESEARKIAEKEVGGFKAKEAKKVEDAWEVILEKEKDTASVFIGLYDGLVRHVIHKKSAISHFKSDPLKVAGVAIIVGVMAFSLLNFQGFPGFTNRLAPFLGLEPQTIEDFFGGSRELPQGCVSATKLALNYNPAMAEYENEEIRQRISDESGYEIEWMYQIEYQQELYILAVDSAFKKICSATHESFCECINIPEF